MNENNSETDASTEEANVNAETNTENGEGNATSTESPLKEERARLEGKTRTEKEKAEFTLKKNAERVKELGGDPNAVLGVIPPVLDDINEDDNTPLTRGDLKKFQGEQARKTATSLAEGIADEDEREIVKYHLSNTIRSSGNAEEDVKNARALANASRNAIIAEEAGRKKGATSHGSGSGAPAKIEGTFEPTAEEQVFMRQFKLSKEQVLEARRKTQEKRG